MIRPPQSLLSLGPSDSAKTLEEGRVCVCSKSWFWPETGRQAICFLTPLLPADAAAASSFRSVVGTTGCADAIGKCRGHGIPSVFMICPTLDDDPQTIYPRYYWSSKTLKRGRRISWWNSTLLLNWFLKKKKSFFFFASSCFYGVSRLVPCINFRTGLLRSTGPVNFVG